MECVALGSIVWVLLCLLSFELRRRAVVCSELSFLSFLKFELRRRAVVCSELSFWSFLIF